MIRLPDALAGVTAVAAAIAACAASAFDLQGHRGARGLAPENTLPAFERALQLGVTTLELDIAVTKDGVAVIHHDQTLNPDLTPRIVTFQATDGTNVSQLARTTINITATNDSPAMAVAETVIVKSASSS